MKPWGFWGGKQRGCCRKAEIKLKQEMLERPQLRGSKERKICQRGLRDERLVLASRGVPSGKELWDTAESGGAAGKGEIQTAGSLAEEIRQIPAANNSI